MEINIDREEARVLGCLLEKEMATPEYYPLSLNALVNACNQKSNRNPVVNYNEKTVLKAIDRLVDKDLVFESRLSRVPKYEELIMKKLNLVSREASILCILLLRAEQTAGEIRARTERLYAFDDLDQVLDTIADLTSAGYIEKIPRQPGQKEDRYRHCLAGPEMLMPGEIETVHEPEKPFDITEESPPDTALQERVVLLEETVQELTRELEILKQQFEAFKSQFE